MNDAGEALAPICSSVRRSRDARRERGSRASDGAARRASTWAREGRLRGLLRKPEHATDGLDAILANTAPGDSRLPGLLTFLPSELRRELDGHTLRVLDLS